MRSGRVRRTGTWFATWLVAWGVFVLEQPRAQQGVFRAGVTMVPIDVRAFDRQGKPVSDLTAEDLQIFEDGVRQRIAHFSTQAFTPTGPVERRVALEPVAGPPPQAAPSTRASIPPQTSRVYLIVLGRGRLQSANLGVDGVLHFVRNRLLPQDRAAILAYNRATDFTTDHASLVPVLERYRKAHEDIEVKLTLYFSGLAGLYRDPRMPAFLQPDIDRIFAGPANTRTMPLQSGASDRTDADYRRRVTGALVGDPSASLSERAEAALEGLSFDAFVAVSVKEGLDASNIQAGLDYLRHIEGEKHLVYIAYGGFKTSAFLGSLEGLARAASDARVALDIVHTGGLEYRGFGATSQPRTIAETKLRLDTDPFRGYFYGGATIGSAQTSRMLAAETGGTFNASRYRLAADDLTAMDLANRFQYTLGYYPSRTTTDGSYRKIEVRTTRPGVTLQFRRGYYARPPQPALGRRELLSYTRISRAFEYAPPIDDIRVRGQAALSKGASDVDQVRVDVTIDTSRLAFELVNGRHVGSVEAVVFAIDGRQRQVADLWQRLELDLSEATYQKFVVGGIPYTATLQVPAPLRVQAVKVVVYDYAADLVGSVVLKTGR
jgi:VWFA-related protein